MALDGASQRYRVIACRVNVGDLNFEFEFPSDLIDRGRIVATVQVGGANAGGVPVQLYTHSPTIPFQNKNTDTFGRADFTGLSGYYDVEAIAGHPLKGCVHREDNVYVPADPAEVVEVWFSLPCICVV